LQDIRKQEDFTASELETKINNLEKMVRGQQRKGDGDSLTRLDQSSTIEFKGGKLIGHSKEQSRDLTTDFNTIDPKGNKDPEGCIDIYNNSIIFNNTFKPKKPINIHVNKQTGA